MDSLLGKGEFKVGKLRDKFNCKRALERMLIDPKKVSPLKYKKRKKKKRKRENVGGEPQ